MTWHDPIEYAEQVMQDALEEDAYYREKDRELEEQQQRERNMYPGFNAETGACNRCGKDAYLPAPMGGCFCV